MRVYSACDVTSAALLVIDDNGLQQTVFGGHFVEKNALKHGNFSAFRRGC
jgi:hypothetical protein